MTGIIPCGKLRGTAIGEPRTNNNKVSMLQDPAISKEAFRANTILYSSGLQSIGLE